MVLYKFASFITSVFSRVVLFLATRILDEVPVPNYEIELSN